MREAAGSLKRVSLELGGKSPNVVFADADMEAALRGAMTGIFYNKGEVCAAGSRLLVEQRVHDEFVGKLVERVKGLKVGDPMDKGTRMGPVVSAQQLETVMGYVEAGRREGATLAAGGERVRVGDGRGYFVQPTVFTGVSNTMRIAREEIFGPVLSVIPFKDADDAVAQGNETFYGLAAAVWTRDVGKALGWPVRSAPEPSGSTRTISSTPPCPSAASRSRVSGASSARPGWTSTRRSRASGSTSPRPE